MSKVWLAPMTYDAPAEEVAAKVGALWEAAGLASCFRERDLAALKLHVGEPGTTSFVSPRIARELAGRMAATGARPFLTDTAVLYKSRRDNGVDHALVAVEHGFGFDRVGAPFVPADGLNGADAIEVEVGGRHYESVAIASAILHARSMLVLTHATGHLGTGFGGALKNLGMGCSSKKGKLRQHHGQHPRIDGGKCIVCGTCAEWCPTDSISMGEASAVIEEATCIGCGECVAACLEGAVKFDWSSMGRELSERIVEHAAGVTRGKPGRIAYVTSAVAITKNCDCLGVSEEGLLEDIGLLASTDPVAIDQAVLDLVRERAGKRLEDLSYPDRDGSVQIAYAEELGLGSREVELVVLDLS